MAENKKVMEEEAVDTKETKAEQTCEETKDTKETAAEETKETAAEEKDTKKEEKSEKKGAFGKKKKDKKELIKRYNPPLNLRDNHNPCIKDFQKEVSRRRRIIDELSNHLDYSPQ